MSEVIRPTNQVDPLDLNPQLKSQFDPNKCPQCGSEIFWEWQSQLWMCTKCLWDSWQPLSREEVEDRETKYLEDLSSGLTDH